VARVSTVGAKVRPGVPLGPAHVLLTSDPGGGATGITATDGLTRQRHGRGPCNLDARAGERGRVPGLPVGETVRARLSPCPPA
jgi:hypothetical protein